MELHFKRYGAGLALITSLLAPLSAFAYLSPEDVFGNGPGALHGAAPDRTDETTYAPPLAREADQVALDQQKKANERRAEEQKALVPDYAEPMDTYVPEQRPKEDTTLTPEAAYEKRMERMAEQRGSSPTIFIGGNGTVTDKNGNVLHSGAPLISKTGPETILAFAAMILAAVSTFLYAQFKSCRIRMAL